MSPSVRCVRIQYRPGALAAAVETMLESMNLVEGEELDLRREDERIIIERVRSQPMEPESG